MKTHGGDIYTAARELGIRPEECLDFSANLNPLGIPAPVKQTMAESLDQAVYYPDPDSASLIRALSRRYGIREEAILAGNGAADLIFRLVYALKPSKALITAPTFLEYKEALLQAGSQVEVYSLDAGFELQEDILDRMDKDVKLMFLCNPNNPTGLLTGRELLLKIAKKAEENGIVLAVDECFLDFTGEEDGCTMTPWLGEFKNLLVLKSFTKMFAVPGIRLGYLLCENEELVQRIKAAGQSWSVNCVAEAAGLAALTQQEFIKKTASYIKEEREYLTACLEALNLRVIPGKANYLLIQAEKCPGLYHKLMERQILIRRCSNYDGLDETYYRIAVRTHEENEKLIGALRQVMKGE